MTKNLVCGLLFGVQLMAITQAGRLFSDYQISPHFEVQWMRLLGYGLCWLAVAMEPIKIEIRREAPHV